MDWELFPRGLVIGISVAAPVGPMAMLCFRRTVAQGRVAGLLSGFGVAVADACYGAVAAFGLTSISEYLLSWSDWLRLFGGLFLVLLGIRTVHIPPVAVSATTASRGSIDGMVAFGSTFGLTLANPTTILSFLAIFAGFGMGDASHGMWAAASLVVGVLLGSALWWIFFTSAVASLRSRLTPQRFTWINRATGVAIAVFGVVAVASIIDQ